MADSIPSDPFAAFRGWVGEWEKLVNQHGGEWLTKPEVAQAMQQMTSAKLQAQAASEDAMAKLLASANMPSKADVVALGERLAAIEAALLRIEAQLRGGDTAPKPRPALKRTRQPGS